MNFLPTILTISWRQLSALVLGAACLPLAANGQTILETYSDSLTTYLAGATSWQGVTPRADQRAVQLDGTLRASPMWAAAIAGNPWGDGAPSRGRLGDIRLDNGTYSPTEVDLALPSKGFPWLVGRSYNIRQSSASNGPQGRNWFQSSRPEIKLFAGATTAADVLYVAFGADRYIELQRTGLGATTFKAKNGAAGVAHYVSGSPDTYIYSDQNGNQLTFFGGNTGQASANWQLWKVTDPASNTAYTGHASTAATAVTNGFSASGMTTAYDATGRRYTYTYTTIDSAVRLTQVKAELDVSGTWTEVGKVDYDYYAGGDTDLANGDPGNLRLVTITTPLTPSATSLVRKTYYRYDTTTDAVTYVVGPEGTRALTSYQTASASTLKPYTTAYFEYDGSVRINKAFFNGECGCSGGNNGEYEFTYDANPGFSGTAGYDTAWANRTVVEQPDSVYQVRYFDETGQPLSSVVMASNPAVYSGNQWWATEWVRNSSGQTTAIYSPASISAYAHDVATVPTGTFTRQASAGLVSKIGRVSSGDMAGFIEKTGYQEGNTPSTYTLTGYSTYSGQSFTPVSGATVVRPHVTETRAYHTATDQASPNTSANYDATTFSYTFHSATASSQQVVAYKSITTTAPTVSTGNNGSGSATSAVSYVRTDGTTAFTKTALGIYSYAFISNGQTIKTVADVDATSGAVDASDSPSGIWGWSLPTAGDGLRLTTEYAYDRQGRLSTVTLPTGRVTKTVYTRLSDHRPATISIPRFASGNWYGPLSYQAMNQAGQNVFSGVIALSSPVSDGTAIVDTTASDPVTALLTGTLSRVKGATYSADGGKVQSFRVYTTLPSTMAASSGFDETTYVYDDLGRVIRTVDATGTIARTVLNTRGLPIERSVGTNDNGLTGGSSSGTNNMTTTDKSVYDGGNSNGQGNGHLTSTLRDADGDWTGTTTDQRITQTTYDFRGRAVIQEQPASPHTLTKYDNLGRVLAVGKYSSVSGLTVSSDPTASSSSDRIGLIESSFDERGMVWKAVLHEIVQSTGNKNGSLTSYQWYDEDGQRVKTAGPKITKTSYDRVGRVVGDYVIESTDDGTTYANCKNVAGDSVIEERHSGYAPGTGLAILKWSVQRPHDSGFWSSGSMDTNSDGNWLTISGADIFGRLQISTTYYDAWDRPVTEAKYGTYNIAADGTSTSTNFDRVSITTVPTYATSNVIVRATTYDDNGEAKDVVDPKGRTRRTAFDTAGRQTSVIDNYTDGTPGGGTDNDQDRVTEYTYATGGMVATVTQKAASSGDDQTTTYTYGTTKSTTLGTDSYVATGNLLLKVVHPEQTSGQAEADRREQRAYNALGEVVWRKDPVGTVFFTTVDNEGHVIRCEVLTFGSGIDTTVTAVETTYNAHGTVYTVAQLNSSNATISQVKYEYDDWQVLKNFEQDPDSAIGGSGHSSFKLTWTNALHTPTTFNDGWQSVRTDSYAQPDGSSGGQSISLNYNTSGTQIQSVSMGGVSLAEYSCMGLKTVINQYHPETEMFQQASDTSMVNYSAFMDRYGRPTRLLWLRSNAGLTVPPIFANHTLAYDELGLVKYKKDYTSRKDLTQHNFDLVYSYDALRRLKERAEGSANSGGTAIDSGKEARDEKWSRNIVGQVVSNKVDLSGNTTYTDGSIPAKDNGEMDDTRTVNKRNQVTSRSYLDKDNPVTAHTATVTIDKNGNLTDDGDKYAYDYDAWCHLVAMRLRGTSTYVGKFTTNALGLRTSEQYDTNRSANDGQPDGAVNSSDPVFYVVSDQSGRRLATFRGSDTYPKATFVYHPGCMTGPQFKPGVLLRDRNASLTDPTKWATETASSTRAERHYYLSDHRGFTIGVIDDADNIVEHYRYSQSGTPFGVPAGDMTWDGLVQASGVSKPDKDLFETIKTNYDGNNITGYDIRADLNLDGSIDSTDRTMLVAAEDGKNLGRGKLSGSYTATQIMVGGVEWREAFGAGEGPRRRALLPWLANNVICLCCSVGGDCAPPDAGSTPCAQSGSYLYGPEAAIISWVHSSFTASGATQALILMEASLPHIRDAQPDWTVRAAMWNVHMVVMAQSRNPTPPSSIGRMDGPANWSDRKESRGYLYYAPIIECDCDGKVIWGYPRSSGAYAGTTPMRGGVYTHYLDGQQHPTQRGDVSARIQPDDECMLFQATDGARVSQSALAVIRDSTGVTLPWIHRTIKYETCCSGTGQIDYSGSIFPSHRAYANGDSVGDALAGMWDFAQFVYGPQWAQSTPITSVSVRMNASP